MRVDTGIWALWRGEVEHSEPTHVREGQEVTPIGKHSIPERFAPCSSVAM